MRAGSVVWSVTLLVFVLLSGARAGSQPSAAAPAFGAASASASASAPASASASASGAASASASASAPGAASASSARPLRRKTEEVEVELVDLTENDRDPQAIGAGLQLGAGWLTNRGSGFGVFAVDFAFVGEIGLGPGGARVPWTLEPWVAFALTYGREPTHPNRFTEIGVRLVHRFASGLLDGRWVSLGTGLVWTSHRPERELSAAEFGICIRNIDEAKARGIDCNPADISPGLLVDVGFGLVEWTARRARWGVGVRAPVQISAYPGVGAIGFFYAQLGTGL